MADPKQLAQAIVDHLGALDPDHAEQLRNSAGYAFQAYVLTTVGVCLSGQLHWDWVHPNGGPARFAVGNRGGALPNRLSGLTHLIEPGDRAVLAQGVTVSGRSTATHDLDLVGIADIRGGKLNFRDLPSLPEYPPPVFLVTGLECKNEADNQSMDTAREQACLAMEIGRLPVWVGWTGGHLLGANLVLVSASGVTPNAASLLRAYGIRWSVDVTVEHEPGWADELATSIASSCERRHGE